MCVCVHVRVCARACVLPKDDIQKNLRCRKCTVLGVTKPGCVSETSTDCLTLDNSIPLDHSISQQKVNCSTYLFNNYVLNVHYVPDIFLGSKVSK